jgi:prepilin-type N-terminal cleavage/methylation domain-containing protein
MKASSRVRDRGFTLVELLVAIVVLGVLATVTVFAVRGMTDRAQSSACAAELSSLRTATEAYFALYAGASSSGIATQAYAADTGFSGNPAGAAVPAPTGVTAGSTPGKTLVNVGLLRSEPTLLFVSPTGQILNANARCGTLGQPSNGDTSSLNAASGGNTPTSSAFTGVLDGLATQPVAAYSLRKLRSSYSGAAVTVRRSSDNSTADIGFTAAGDLDTAALIAFVGTGDGFVTTVYDQSGNGRNAVQGTAANQPVLVTAGSIRTLGGRPALDLHLHRGVLSAAGSSYTMAQVITVIQAPGASFDSYHTIVSHDGPRSGTILQVGGDVFHSNLLPASIRKNGTALSSGGAPLGPLSVPMQLTVETVNSTSARTRIGFGNYDTTVYGGAARQGDTIVFASALSASDRATVEASIGAFYGIAIA